MHTSLSLLLCSIALNLVSLAAYADEAVSGALRQSIEAAISKNTQGEVHVQEIQKTPIHGLFQVDTGDELMYVDESGRYALVGGAMIDLHKRLDLTAAHRDKQQSVSFSELPLQYAIKQVHGSGARKMAIFEDPNCPICRVFTKFVDQLPDVTVYRFMFPIVDPKSEGLARVAWCAADRATTWQAIMDGARPRGRETCDTSGLVEILKTAERLKIQATPTVFLGNGKRLVGATPPEQFVAELDASMH